MRRILLMSFLVFAFTAKAQNAGSKEKESYTFSLDQAISHAMEHNYEIINAGRDIQIAEKQKWETTAAGLPQLNGGVDYIHNFEYMAQGITGGGAFGGKPGEIITIAFGTKNSMNARATLSQLIFDGSYIVALQSAKTFLKYYENAKTKQNIDVKEAVINAYGNVLLTKESIEILKKNKEILEKTLFETQQTFKNGLIEEESVEQLQITLASINSAINNNNRLLEVNHKLLKLLLGIEYSADIKLTDSLDNLTTKNVDLSLMKSEFNANDNINFQIVQNLNEQRKLEYKLEKSKYLPSLGAAMNLGSNSFSNTFTFFNTSQKWNYYNNVGVSLNVPIFSSFARNARVQKAKIALDQAKTTLTETEQQLNIQFETAKSYYEFSIEELGTAKNNLALAERIEKKQQVKFAEGLSSSIEYNEAQRQLYASQQNYLQSMVNVISRKAALEKIITTK